MLPRVSVATVAVVALLSACSSSSSSSPTTTATAGASTSPVVASSPSSTPTTTPGITAAGGAATTSPSVPVVVTSGDPGCDVSEAVNDALASNDVLDVSVDAECTSVDISTSLTPSEAKIAVALCDAAAPTAYAGAISAINVEGVDGNILASGTKSNGVVVPCATNG